MNLFQRIVVPTDFSEFAAEALHYACAFAERFDSELQLLHVIPDYRSQIPDFAMGLSRPPTGGDFEAVREQWEEKAIAELAHVLPEGWQQGKGKRVVLGTRFGTPFVEIIRYAKENDADAIIMGTHGRTALPHMLLGSVAEKVVRKAACPVLTVRPAQHAFVPPTVPEIPRPESRNPKTVIRHAIEALYGPCPVDDFARANEWANKIDWEFVKARIDKDHPGFHWVKGDLRGPEAAEAQILKIRHEMLHAAGAGG